MNIRTLSLAMSLAVTAMALIGAPGLAQASPMLEIVGSGGGAPDAANAEAIGDPGGTLYTNGPTAGASAGPGMPTDLGGWPAGAGFAPDPSFGGALGISGWDASYLNLTESGNVTFQFMGMGDATNHNIFQIFVGGVWTTIWDNQSASNGTCGMSGPTTPDCSPSGSQYTMFLDAGLIPFLFQNLTTGDVAVNDGAGNPSPDKSNNAGYFLGMDPYLASGTWTSTGKVAYAGFTDQPLATGGDHDYEDLIVRMSVPEPGSIFLLGVGLVGLASTRKRKV